MSGFRRTLIFFLIFTVVASFFAYRLVVNGYDKMYEAQQALAE